VNFDRVICPVCKDKTTVQIPNSGKQVLDVAELGNTPVDEGYENLPDTNKSKVDWTVQECEECFNKIVIGYEEEGDSGGLLF
jgi:hypothetical protein